MHGDDNISGVIILSTQTLHYHKGNPSKWPYICSVWSQKIGNSMTLHFGDSQWSPSTCGGELDSTSIEYQNPKVPKVTFGRSYWFSLSVTSGWWFRNPANQLRLVVEIPLFTRLLYIQTVVGNGISSINSCTQKYHCNLYNPLRSMGKSPTRHVWFDLRFLHT